MLSRRNIRVKVMQTLYSVESMNNDTRIGEPLQILKKKLEHSQELFAYLIFFIIEVARYSEKDAVQKAGKLLPTLADRQINTKIAGNEIVWAALENSSFKKTLEQFKIKYLNNDELIRKTYISLVNSTEYKDYISEQSRNKKSEKKIIEFIFSDLMLENENFVSEVEEHFIHWDDDAEVLIQLMSNFFQKPAHFEFYDMVGSEKMTFATELLDCVLSKNEYCLEIIKPKLKNWDSERIAALDMILMKMGVCELLYFETIPPKVTINEYIDMAKEYSTEQSGHFINGILDNIHKDFVTQDMIHKKSFKNSTI
ncbi:MAG: transcription antitermination factor NusB [Ginsengibacter sp.]